MRRINSFSEYCTLNEFAMVSKTGKSVMADGKKVRDMHASELSDNLVFIIEKRGNPLVAKGKFWLYFVDNPDWIDKLNKSEYDMLFFPIRTMSNAWTVSPISDVWKKSYSNRFKGSDHIIGMIEGHVSSSKKKVYIEMMSVRPKFQHNKINSIMIEALEDKYKRLGYKTVYVDPTDDGQKFINVIDPKAEVLRTRAA